MSARSARRLLERLLCDPAFVQQLSAEPLTVSFFEDVCAPEGYTCSLAEVQTAGGEDANVPAELWFAALPSELSAADPSTAALSTEAPASS